MYVILKCVIVYFLYTMKYLFAKDFRNFNTGVTEFISFIR